MSIAQFAVTIIVSFVAGYSIKGIGTEKILADIEQELKAVEGVIKPSVEEIVAAIRKHL